MSRRLSLEDLKFWKLIQNSVRENSAGFVAPLREPYSPILDLHGMQIHPAYHCVLEHIAEAKRLGMKRITVITGRSGPINQEFTRWLEDRPDILKIAAKNGGGAYDVWLRNATSTQTR